MTSFMIPGALQRPPLPIMTGMGGATPGQGAAAMSDSEFLDRITSQLDGQDERVADGLAEGQLDSDQAALLGERTGALSDMAQELYADGSLSDEERAELERALYLSSDAIFRLRNHGDDEAAGQAEGEAAGSIEAPGAFNAAAAASENPFAELMDSQAQAISEGEENGQLDSVEATHLNLVQSDLASALEALKQDTGAGAEQYARMLAMVNMAGAEIFQLLHKDAYV